MKTPWSVIALAALTACGNYTPVSGTWHAPAGAAEVVTDTCGLTDEGGESDPIDMPITVSAEGDTFTLDADDWIDGIRDCTIDGRDFDCGSVDQAAYGMTLTFAAFGSFPEDDVMELHVRYSYVCDEGADCSSFEVELPCDAELAVTLDAPG